MFPYHFTVCHIPGPTNQLADCLLRLGNQKDNIKLTKLYVYQITIQLKARSDTLNQLCTATQEDDELILLKHMITNGWLNSLKEVPSEIQAYWMFQEELTIEDGLILKGSWIVIPNSKHKQILQLIHEGHLGLGKCKLQCKDMVYWPGIWTVREISLELWAVLKYSKAKSKQAPDMSLGQRSSNTSLDKSCHQHISLWEWVLLTLSRLHQQISYSP